jgi:hypothetical protein
MRYTLLDTLNVLKNEIEYAKNQLMPHDTGHISTAISWMNTRVSELEEEINARLHDQE